MLDTKKVGIKIALLRKKIGLSQEKLAELLNISPQAISKWENGHTLPETSLLPVLSQIFSCTIDEILIPAYSFDVGIEENKPTILEEQAEYIAKYVIQKLGEKHMTEKTKQIVGLDDNTIITAVLITNPNIGECTVKRGKLEKNHRYTSLKVTVTTPQKEIKLIEKIYSEEDHELHGYKLFSQHTLYIPKIFYIDIPQKIILAEDLSHRYIQGFHFNDNSAFGKIIRENYKAFIRAVAKFHTVFWEDKNTFEQIGLDWRHESEENILVHINGMENDFLEYRRKEEIGDIPKVWDVFENNIDPVKLDYFQTAILLLKQRYTELISTRFTVFKNITVIHGDLHPGNTFMSKSSDRSIKFIDMQAVRIGLCTEDLAMLIALHIAPDKEQAQPLLDYYYRCLCEVITDYPYELFIKDYKLSIMEIMFFTIKLINIGICDFSMRDKAMKAFETFILRDE